ncbi:MAG TPA: hypothetical protein VFB45_11075 [Pseudolabrys sp.]|nr:hypothetical protein [Pseudolabrys sp.]
MDPKLTFMFVLLGVIIAFSYLGDEQLARIKEFVARLKRRDFVLVRRRS